MAANSFPALVEFLLGIDRLKTIERRSYVAGGTRRENSAEHSWHVALCAWALSTYLAWDVSVERLLKLALIHDLGEMESGDTFLYADDREDASKRERAAVARLAQRHLGVLPELEALWDEQERGYTPEARLLRIADRILPLMHNLAVQGRTWREHGISRSQVLQRHEFIAADAPELFEWIRTQLDRAVANGWLAED